MKPQYGVIYLGRNKVTGEQYVGKALDFKNRVRVHLRAKGDTALAKDIQLYGKESFEFEVVYNMIPEWMMASLEERTIASLDTFLGFGYNRSKGKGGAVGMSHPATCVEVIQDIESISQRYLNGETACKIAEEYGVGADTIANHLRKNGIEVRSVKEAKQFKMNRIKDQIIDEYKNGKSITKLVKETGISKGPIRKLLNDSGIQIRSNKRLDLQSRSDEIIAEYLKGYSVRYLTKIFKCDPETIYKILKNNNIQLRSRPEQMKISLALKRRQNHVTAE